MSQTHSSGPGIPEKLDSERRYDEYCRMCKVDELTPFTYLRWLQFDLDYLEHVKTAQNPLSVTTFQKMNTPKPKPSIQELESEVQRLTHLVEDLEGQRDRAIHFKEEAEKEVYRLSDRVQDLLLENDKLINRSMPKPVTIPANQPKFPHYFKHVPNCSHVDIYWVLKAWDVTDPCVQHAVKKLMAAGIRGAKNKEKDLLEARDSISRALELEETK